MIWQSVLGCCSFIALAWLLFYWKVLPVVVRAFSWCLRKTMDVGGAEGLANSVNVFVGVEHHRHADRAGGAGHPRRCHRGMMENGRGAAGVSRVYP